MNEAYLRSLLFVPATRLDRIKKAFSSNADAIVVDLEDAVAPNQKESARSELADYLKQNPDLCILIRVNGSDSAEFQRDLLLCKSAPNVVGVMLPKASTKAEIEHVSQVTQKRVWPLIESGAGVMALPEIVSSDNVARLSIGALDLAADLGLESDSKGAEKVLDYCRSQVVIHSRIGGLAPPVESVVPVIDESEKIQNAANQAKEMGFGGMLAIHPRQVLTINREFSPTVEQIEWADRVIAGTKKFGAVFQVDGKMVDAPVVQQARNILAKAKLK